MNKIRLAIHSPCTLRDAFEIRDRKTEAFEVVRFVQGDSFLCWGQDKFSTITGMRFSQDDFNKNSACWYTWFQLNAHEINLTDYLQEKQADYALISCVDVLQDLCAIKCKSEPAYLAYTNAVRRNEVLQKKNIVYELVKPYDLDIGFIVAKFRDYISFFQKLYGHENVIYYIFEPVNKYVKAPQVKEFLPKQIYEKQLKLLRYLNDLARNEDLQIISVDAGEYANPGHKWGLHPLHYQDRVYKDIVDKTYELLNAQNVDAIRLPASTEVLKLQFTDFWPGFDKNNNFILNYLKKITNVVISDKPDIVFYSSFGTEYLKYRICIRVFITDENQPPDFSQCDYAMTYRYITYGDRHFRRTRFVSKREFENIAYEKRKFCTFISSNTKTGEGAVLRKKFASMLMNYKHVDCPGKVLNNMDGVIKPFCALNWGRSAINFMKQYKFTIAFENMRTEGYLTEKLPNALMANTIPIYWGDPCANIQFNPRAFIDCTQFRDFQEVIEYVKYLDNDDDAYLAMLHEPPMATAFNAQEHDWQKFISNIIKNGTIQRNLAKPYFDQPLYNYDDTLSIIEKELVAPILAEGEDKHCILEAPKRRGFQKDQLYVIENLGKRLTNHIAFANNIASYLRFQSGSSSMSGHLEKVIKSVAIWQQTHAQGRHKIIWSQDANLEQQYRDMFRLLWPQQAKGMQMALIGVAGEEGHVMPEPGNNGVVLSLVQSCGCGWEKEMAERGFKVFKCVVNVDTLPIRHNHIMVEKTEICKKQDICTNEVSISELLTDASFAQETNVILKIDVADQECDLLMNLPECIMDRFMQIIVVFNKMTVADQVIKCHEILSSLTKKFAPVHICYRNSDFIRFFSDFIVADNLEVVFMRRDNSIFSNSTLEFPVALNNKDGNLQELYIGKFSVLTGIDDPPPEDIPSRFSDDFTMQNSVPVKKWYLDSRNNSTVHIDKEKYDAYLQQYSRNEFSYYGETLNYIKSAIAAFPIQNKTVYLRQSDACSCIAVAEGAAKVYLATRCQPLHEHKNIENYILDAFQNNDIKTDFAISVSDITHIGLGRYGDKIEPDGDLRVMGEIKEKLQAKGILILSVSVGQDCLVWNAHRIYGKLRLPLLLSGWNFLASYGLSADIYDAPLGKWDNQPVLVLSKDQLAVNIPQYATPEQRVAIEALVKTRTFDSDYYIQQYPDILTGQMDALSHYVIFGARECRNPNSWFCSKDFMAKHSSLDWDKVNPLLFNIQPGFYGDYIIDKKYMRH